MVHDINIVHEKTVYQPVKAASSFWRVNLLPV